MGWGDHHSWLDEPCTALRDWLDAQGMTLSQLAAQCGVSDRTMDTVAAGHSISRRTAQAVADATGIDVELFAAQGRSDDD